MLEVVTWARLRGSLGSGKEILDTASAVRETRGRLRNGSTHYGFDPLAGQDKTEGSRVIMVSGVKIVQEKQDLSHFETLKDFKSSIC